MSDAWVTHSPCVLVEERHNLDVAEQVAEEASVAQEAGKVAQREGPRERAARHGLRQRVLKAEAVLARSEL